jgi:hypothetical protein
MQTADFNPDDFTQSGQSALDEQLFVRFYLKERQHPSASKEAGRPIFREVEYVEIRAPGSRDFVARPAKEKDRARFPRHYAAFKQRIEAPQEGTPLKEWSLVTRSQAEELAFFNVKTVEQLAETADVHLSNFMGGSGLKRKAQEWLESTSAARADAKQQEALQEMLASRDAQIATLIKELAELKAANSLAPEETETPAASESEPSAPPPTTRRRRSKAEAQE